MITHINSFGEVFDWTVLIGHVADDGGLDCGVPGITEQDRRMAAEWSEVAAAANETTEYNDRLCFLAWCCPEGLFVSWEPWLPQRDVSWAKIEALVVEFGGHLDEMDLCEEDGVMMRQASMNIPADGLTGVQTQKLCQSLADRLTVIYHPSPAEIVQNLTEIKEGLE